MNDLRLLYGECPGFLTPKGGRRKCDHLWYAREDFLNWIHGNNILSLPQGTMAEWLWRQIRIPVLICFPMGAQVQILLVSFCLLLRHR